MPKDEILTKEGHIENISEREDAYSIQLEEEETGEKNWFTAGWEEHSESNKEELYENPEEKTAPSRLSEGDRVKIKYFTTPSEDDSDIQYRHLIEVDKREAPAKTPEVAEGSEEEESEEEYEEKESEVEEEEKTEESEDEEEEESEEDEREGEVESVTGTIESIDTYSGNDVIKLDNGNSYGVKGGVPNKFDKGDKVEFEFRFETHKGTQYKNVTEEGLTLVEESEEEPEDITEEVKESEEDEGKSEEDEEESEEKKARTKSVKEYAIEFSNIVDEVAESLDAEKESELVKAGATAILQERGKDRRLTEMNGKGEKEASEAQKDFLDDLDVDYDEDITKKEASELISENK